MPPRRKVIAAQYMLIAWASLARWFFLGTTVLLMAATLVTKDKTFLAATGISAALLVLSAFVFLIEHSRVRCLTCGAALLRKLGCRPHGNARRLLGSHTLPVTLKIARFPDFVTCPYCDGRFRLAGKSRRGDDVERSGEWPDDHRRRRRVRR